MRFRDVVPRLSHDGRAEKETVRQSVSIKRLRRDIEELSMPRNRLHSPQAMLSLEEYVHRELEHAGWEVSHQSFSFRNVMGLVDYPVQDGNVTHLYSEVNGQNLVAIPRNCDRTAPPDIIVTAHMDTVKDCPGADDNASGIAGLLELARVFSTDMPNRLALAILDCEEIGFFGARAFVQQHSWVKATFVLECIGYTNSNPRTQIVPSGLGLLYRDQMRFLRSSNFKADWALILYESSGTALANLMCESLSTIAGTDRVMKIREPTSLPLVGGVLKRLFPWTGEFARSDHVEFWRAGIPAVLITDTANFRNPNYHETTDTPETIDYDFIADIVASLVKVIKVLDKAR